MYRLVQGTTDLPDAAAFLEILSNLDQHPLPEARQLFAGQLNGSPELFVTRAPGRLDVMGGIADYSGSLVLELPTREATFAALQRDPDRQIKIVSLAADPGQSSVFEMSLNDLESDGRPVDYEVARAYFHHDPSKHWAAYVSGVFLVLMRERQIVFRDGARILISSLVPEGKGVSSSAALEVAVMQAVAAAFAIEIAPGELARFCQMVENLVVGAPCGIMDQMTSVCGEENRLLALLCQPAELQEMISIPDEIAFWGLDSGVRHSVAGADYGSVRTGAFMGYRIIAELAGLTVKENAEGGLCRIDDSRWGGYLSNVTPAEFEQCYAAHLPERIEGAEFIARYSGTTDPVTRIAAERSYAVRIPTAHAIDEHQRVRAYAELIKGPLGAQQLEQMGQLMYESHQSYSACGLNSDGTDLLVSLVRAASSSQGLYGAKITGGGSGGTVAVLGNHDAGKSVGEIADKYARATGYAPYVFTGSSPGSAAFGYLELEIT
jgi:galactokinase